MAEEEEKQRNEVLQTVVSKETNLFSAHRDITGKVSFWMRIREQISEEEIPNLLLAISLQHEGLLV